MAIESDALRQSYIDLSGTLIVVSTFAGTVTLSTQFITNCPGSLLQTCLEISAQFFLAAPLAIIAIYGLLHGIEGRINFWTHCVVLAQFVLVEFLLAAAFSYLAVAILEFEGSRLGWAGIALVAALGLNLATCHVVNYVAYEAADPRGGLWAELARFGRKAEKEEREVRREEQREGVQVGEDQSRALLKERNPTMTQMLCVSGYVCCLVIEYAAAFSVLGNAVVASTRAPTFRFVSGGEGGCLVLKKAGDL